MEKQPTPDEIQSFKEEAAKLWPLGKEGLEFDDGFGCRFIKQVIYQVNQTNRYVGYRCAGNSAKKALWRIKLSDFWNSDLRKDAASFLLCTAIYSGVICGGYFLLKAVKGIRDKNTPAVQIIPAETLKIFEEERRAAQTGTRVISDDDLNEWAENQPVRKNEKGTTITPDWLLKYHENKRRLVQFGTWTVPEQVFRDIKKEKRASIILNYHPHSY